MKFMKKAQIQTNEMLFAVFLIIIIIILALVFYGRAQESNLKEKIREQKISRLILFAHTISNWPELECSVLKSEDYDCVDLMKLNIIKNFIDDKKKTDGFSFSYYNDLLKRSTIVVNQHYPSQASWVVYNNSANGSRESVYVPVNLYDPINQTFSFATMELTVYE